MAIGPHIDQGWRGKVACAFAFCAFLLVPGHPAAAQENYAGQTLTDMNFLGKNLAGADFSGATLDGVIFDQANLTGATFAGATIGAGTLGPTSFSLANLTNADFSKATLSTTVSFQYATVTGANFSGIDMSRAEFGPVLDFDDLQAPPNFSGTTMTCEFPWLWDRLTLDNATLPTCANGLIDGAQGAPTDGAPSPSLAGPAEQQNPPATQSAQMTTIPIGRMELAADRIGEAVASSNSIYVSTGGTDGASCGTDVTNACKTIAEGVSRCHALGGDCAVLIEYGKYSFTSPLALVNNVSLAGGYVNGQPSTGYQSTIVAPPNGAAAVTAAAGVTSSLKSLILVGTPSTTAGSASVVMSIVGTSGISVDTVNVQAGGGANAGTAANGTTKNGVAGNAWNNGQAGGASQCGTYNGGGNGAPGNKVSTSCSGNWAKGCSYHCSQDGGGNWGTSGGSGQSTGGGGQGVSTASGSPQKACYFDNGGAASANGGNGGTGASATVQAAAASNRIGTFSTSTGAWSQVPGTTGQAGNDGGGGGGGESGSPTVSTHCKIFEHCSVGGGSGVAGGGGGSGGCGATGGQGGAMGGATFAIVLVNADLTVGADLKVVGAQGGTGGTGGAGAVGGTGGGAGSGSSGGGHSGSGGKGGDGGASGGGAGGNGGPSVGIVLVGTSKYTQGPTSIYPGASGGAGKGGAGYSTVTPTGADGQTGLAQATYQVTP